MHVLNVEVNLQTYTNSQVESERQYHMSHIERTRYDASEMCPYPLLVTIEEYPWLLIVIRE